MDNHRLKPINESSDRHVAMQEKIEESLDRIENILSAMLKMKTWRPCETISPAAGQHVVVVDRDYENPISCIYTDGKYCMDEYLLFDLTPEQVGYWVPVGRGV